MPKIVVTGALGFIGFHVCKEFLENGFEVHGIDTHVLDSNYEKLEERTISQERFYLRDCRRAILNTYEKYVNCYWELGFHHTEYNSNLILFSAFENADLVIHLAGFAGVEPSQRYPQLYLENNIGSTLNVIQNLEHCRRKRLIYASSSSVYGGSPNMNPSTESHLTNPRSPYAASKVAVEALVSSYVQSSKASEEPLLATGLRFFTVYGPYGRPDMAVFKWTKALFEGTEITQYIDDNRIMQPSRDYTYISDVVASISRVSSLYLGDKNEDDEFHAIDHQILNVGKGRSFPNKEVITILEHITGKKVRINQKPISICDPMYTVASIYRHDKCLGFKPRIGMEEGLIEFVNWYEEYSKVKHADNS